MTLNPESKYPTRRAYVLKVRGDASPDALAGRIENLVTGQQRDFASGDDLLQSLARDLEASLSPARIEIEATDAGTPTGDEQERKTR
ncbi:MAG TPA: hypothetical protein VMQ50_10880 [Casimicrobiaceae bacterium]|nr:hypothetical protein [Casimicrobiaceae bacterium]